MVFGSNSGVTSVKSTYCDVLYQYVDFLSLKSYILKKQLLIYRAIYYFLLNDLANALVKILKPQNQYGRFYVRFC
ncbi:hypothetical protein R80B4_02040 [Fibrobacteres bacterium R8-0-B4]